MFFNREVLVLENKDGQDLERQEAMEPRSGLEPGADVYPREQGDKIHARDCSPPGLFDLIYGVLFAPGRTFDQVAQNPPLATAAVLYIVLNLLEGLAGFLTAPLYFEGLSMPLPGASGDDLVRSLVPLLFLGGLIYALAKWFLMSGLLHLLAELLGGRGRARGVFTVYALACLPTVLIIPFNIFVLLLFADPWRSGLAGLLGFGVFVWSLVLLVLGLGRVHGLSTGKAALVVLTPALVMLTLLIITLVMVVFIISTSLPPYYKLF